MSSEDDCIENEPERFLSYLTEQSKQLIKSAGNQEEAVERLRACLKKDFAQGDERGVNFCDTGAFDSAENLMILYNAFFKDYRGTGERPSPEVGVLKTEKKMETELSLLEGAVLTIKNAPKERKIKQGGYRRKGFKATEVHERTRPVKFTLKEKAFLSRNMMVHDNKLLSRMFVANGFPPRTVSSIATMKCRLKKKPIVSLTKKI